jgi:hypothetical protein
MFESYQDQAANLHIYAAQAHTAAAAAHHRGEHEAAGELSTKALEFSLSAAVTTEDVAKRMPERLRT